MISFVLINAVSEYEHEVYNRLLKTPEVIEIHPLIGEYDLIAKVEFQNIKGLEEFILNEIKTIKGVLCTKTLTWLTSINE